MARFVVCFLILLYASLGQAQNPTGEQTPQQFYPDDLGGREIWYCGVGDPMNTCLDVSADTLRELDSCAATVNIGGSIGGLSNHLMNRYANSVFFQEIANRSARATSCQISILSGNPEPVADAAWEVYQRIQPLLKTLHDLKSEEQQRVPSAVATTESPYARMGMREGMANVARESQVNIDAIDDSISQLLSQLPFGEQEEVRAAAENLIGRTVNKDQFKNAYKAVLPGLRTKYQEAQSEFNRLRNATTGEYNLSYTDKRDLYRAPGVESLLNQLDPRGVSLRCRFDACYKHGESRTMLGAAVGLGLVTLATLGSASPFLAVGLGVASAALSSTQAYNSCFQNTMNASAELQSSCTPETLARTTYSRMDGLTCAVDVAMLGLDLALPGYAGVRRAVNSYKTSRGIVSAQEAATAAYGPLVRTTPEGAQVYRNAEGIEATIFSSGRREFTYPNGSRVVEEGGVSTTTFRDGTIQTQSADGVRTTRNPDGTRSVRNPDGTTVNYGPDGRVTSRVDANGNTTGNDLIVSADAPSPRRSPAAAAPEGAPAGSLVARTEPSSAARSADAASAEAPPRGELPRPNDAARGTQLDEQIDEAVREFAGANASNADREIIYDILLGRPGAGPRREAYLDSSARGFDQNFADRYRALEERINASSDSSRLRAEMEELMDLRIRQGNRASDDEVRNLRDRDGVPEDDIRDIDCDAMASVYPGSFPSSGGNCKRVRFSEESRGNFCSCGAANGRSVNWLIRCPTSAADFRSLRGYIDELALPHNSSPALCARVNIPAGRECYMGPTAATFAGLGGTSQMLCFGSRSTRAPAVAARERYGLDMPDDAAPQVTATRWSPFSDFPELNTLIHRASTRCPVRCSAAELADIRADYIRAKLSIRSNASTADLARIEIEDEVFATFLEQLQTGRTGFPP